MTKKEQLKVLESQFSKELKDKGNTFSMNGKPMNRAYYNLIICIRDLSLFSKGIKPHRNWRFTPVKKYFGITGGAAKAAEKLEFIKNEMLLQS